MFHVRAHVEYLVDAETYPPLEERLIAERRITAQDVKDSKKPAAVRKALRNGRDGATTVFSRRYLAYERLPLTDANRAKLRIHPSPGAVLPRPNCKRAAVPSALHRFTPAVTFSHAHVASFGLKRARATTCAGLKPQHPPPASGIDLTDLLLLRWSECGAEYGKCVSPERRRNCLDGIRRLDRFDQGSPRRYDTDDRVGP
jgi:hypothetical protein